MAAAPEDLAEASQKCFHSDTDGKTAEPPPKILKFSKRHKESKYVTFAHDYD